MYLGTTGQYICPILGILPPYLTTRGNTPVPLFITEDRVGLTHQTFTALLDSILSKLHIDSRNYNTNRFQICAATTVAQASTPDARIKMLGRWRNDAYQRYIKTPPQELTKAACQLQTTVTVFYC